MHSTPKLEHLCVLQYTIQHSLCSYGGTTTADHHKCDKHYCCNAVQLLILEATPSSPFSSGDVAQ
jgi:hypothetical protein